MSDPTNRILEIFNAINTIPRQSHHLEKIHPWLMNWGREHGFSVSTDDVWNILIKVPATSGYEKAPIIILQGHMDMVCEKRSGVKHDFQNDPITSWQDGEWLRAKDTSLGADNAIALAIFFDLVTDTESEHPELEILITSDEESGLVGAQNLKPDFLSGNILLNLDSEDEGIFTVGCAGGMDINLSFPVRLQPVPKGYAVRRIEVGGLEGGHSGTEIHLNKANANVLLTRVLNNIFDVIPEAFAGEISGGTAHNAIPREARSLVAVPLNHLTRLEELISESGAVLRNENTAVEKNLFLKLSKDEIPKKGLLSPHDSKKMLDTLRMIPNGVKHMSTDVKGIVETSMNFAILYTEGSAVKILTNIRSSVMSRGDDYVMIMKSLARLCGGTCTTGNHYPPWEPRKQSELLNQARRIWKKVSGKDSIVEITHAGLECGAIGSHYPDMDMISFGPTIIQPHSPDEKLHIPSVGRISIFLRELLKSFRNVRKIEK